MSLSNFHCNLTGLALRDNLVGHTLHLVLRLRLLRIILASQIRFLESRCKVSTPFWLKHLSSVANLVDSNNIPVEFRSYQKDCNRGSIPCVRYSCQEPAYV